MVNWYHKRIHSLYQNSLLKKKGVSFKRNLKKAVCGVSTAIGRISHGMVLRLSIYPSCASLRFKTLLYSISISQSFLPNTYFKTSPITKGRSSTFAVSINCLPFSKSCAPPHLPLYNIKPK